METVIGTLLFAVAVTLYTGSAIQLRLLARRVLSNGRLNVEKNKK